MVNIAELKKFFFFNLIGSLIICSLVAVVTVLVGVFNEVTVRVIATLAMVVIHSLVCLAFIWDNEKQNTFERLSFFVNTLFFLIIVSFITSIFGVWKIFPGEIILKFYYTYFLIAFAALHGDILSKALHKERYIDLIIVLNYVFMAIVVLMLIPIIFVKHPESTLGEFYFRLLAAMGIIDGTLSILTIIFYKLFMHKHPKMEDPLASQWQTQPAPKPKKKSSALGIWVWILIIYLFLQVLVPIIFMSLRALG